MNVSDYIASDTLLQVDVHKGVFLAEVFVSPKYNLPDVSFGQGLGFLEPF